MSEPRSIDPSSGSKIPAIRRNIVVLPAPFGPRMPRRCPSRISSDMPSRIRRNLGAVEPATGASLRLKTTLLSKMCVIVRSTFGHCEVGIAAAQ